MIVTTLLIVLIFLFFLKIVNIAKVIDKKTNTIEI